MTGEELKILREAHNLTQAELAAKIKVHQERISKWETGRHKISNSYVFILENFFKSLKKN